MVEKEAEKLAEKLTRGIVWNPRMLVVLVLAALLGGLSAAMVSGIYTLLRLISDALSEAALPQWTLPIIGSVLLMTWLSICRSTRMDGMVDMLQRLRCGVSQPQQAFSGKSGIVAGVGHLLVLSFSSLSGAMGPIIHGVMHVASAVIRVSRLEGFLKSYHKEYLLAAAGAASVSAALDTPVAGAFFAVEVLLRQPSLRHLMPIMVASLCASLVQRHFWNWDRLLLDQGISFVVQHAWEYALFIIIGTLAGLLAMLFSVQLRVMQKLLWQAPVMRFLAPLLGGVVLAFLFAWQPEILPHNVHIFVLPDLFAGAYSPTQWALLLLLLWLGITSSIASGLGLGVLAPSLVLGALIGGGIWLVLSVWLMPLLASVFPAIPSATLVLSDLALYGLVGMAAFAAAIMGAPLFAFLLAFELVNNYSAAIAVMFAVLIASQVMQVFCARSYFHYMRGDYRL